MSADSPEINKPPVAVFEKDFKKEAVAFQPGALPESDSDIYEGLDRSMVAIAAEVDFGGDNRFLILHSAAREGKEEFSGVIEAYRTDRMGKEGKPIYGLRGVEHLKPGQQLDIGKTKMGSTEAYGNDFMSRRHATVSIDESGRISVEDHSTNGSHIKYAEVTEPQPKDEADIDTIPRDQLDKLRSTMAPKPDASQWYKAPEVVAQVEAQNADDAPGLDKKAWVEAKADEIMDRMGLPREGANATPNGDWMKQPHIAAEVAKNSEGESVPEEVVDEVGEVAVSDEVYAPPKEAIKEFLQNYGTGAVAEPQESSPVAAAEPESTPQKPEYEQPDLTQVFSSPESLDAMLKNDNVDPELKRQVSDLAWSWQELQIATAGNEFWKEVAIPQLGELMEAGAGYARDSRQIVDELHQVIGVMTQVSDALDQYGVSGLGQAPNIGQISGTVEKLRHFAGDMPSAKSFLDKARELDLKVLEKDERLKAKAEYGGNIDEETLAGLAAKVAENGGDLNAVRAAIKDDKESQAAVRSWKHRKQGVEDAVQLANAVQMPSNSIDDVIRTFVNAADQTLGQARRSQYDTADIRYIRDGFVNALINDFEMMQRFAALSQQYAEDAQR